MSRFEYLSVLVSIVIALGLSEVTVSWGRLLQDRGRVRFSWLHGFWSAFVLLLMIQFWWGFWNFRTVESWSLLSLLSVVIECVTLVLCALLLTPGRSFTQPLDLERLYYESARPFFVLAAVLLVQLSLVDVLVLGTPPLHPENLVRLAGVALVAAPALSGDRRVHVAVPLVAIPLLAVFLLKATSL